MDLQEDPWFDLVKHDHLSMVRFCVSSHDKIQKKTLLVSQIDRESANDDRLLVYPQNCLDAHITPFQLTPTMM